MTWLFVCPPVIFQAMISSLDDNGPSQSNNRTKSVVPLLILCGLFIFAAFIAACAVKFPFKVLLFFVSSLCCIVQYV